MFFYFCKNGEAILTLFSEQKHRTILKKIEKLELRSQIISG